MSNDKPSIKIRIILTLAGQDFALSLQEARDLRDVINVALDENKSPDYNKQFKRYQEELEKARKNDGARWPFDAPPYKNSPIQFYSTSGNDIPL